MALTIDNINPGDHVAVDMAGNISNVKISGITQPNDSGGTVYYRVYRKSEVPATTATAMSPAPESKTLAPPAPVGGRVQYTIPKVPGALRNSTDNQLVVWVCWNGTNWRGPVIVSFVNP